MVLISEKEPTDHESIDGVPYEKGKAVNTESARCKSISREELLHLGGL